MQKTLCQDQKSKGGESRMSFDGDEANGIGDDEEDDDEEPDEETDDESEDAVSEMESADSEYLTLKPVEQPVSGWT